MSGLVIEITKLLSMAEGGNLLSVQITFTFTFTLAGYNKFTLNFYC